MCKSVHSLSCSQACSAASKSSSLTAQTATLHGHLHEWKFTLTLRCALFADLCSSGTGVGTPCTGGCDPLGADAICFAQGKVLVQCFGAAYKCCVFQPATPCNHWKIKVYAVQAMRYGVYVPTQVTGLVMCRWVPWLQLLPSLQCSGDCKQNLCQCDSCRRHLHSITRYWSKLHAKTGRACARYLQCEDEKPDCHHSLRSALLLKCPPCQACLEISCVVPDF